MSTSELLTLSVIIPNFNHAQYLPGCLKAIFSQSYCPEEVIVIDDASEDQSWQVLKSLKKKYPLLIIQKNEKNIGFTETCNIGIRLSRSKFLAMCAADDEVLPGYFEKSMHLIKKNPAVGLCVSGTCLFYPEEQPRKHHKLHRLASDEPKIFMPEETITLFKKTNYHIHSPATIYKRELLLRYAYKQNLMALADYYLNSSIVLRHPWASVPEYLVSFRVNEKSVGGSARRDYFRRFLYYQNFLKELNLEDKAYKKAFFAAKNLSAGGFFMLLALLVNPNYWPHLPGTFFKVFKNKWQSFQFTRNR